MRKSTLPICLAAALAFGLLAAHAVPVTYDFSVTVTEGPLAGTTATGFFTIDDEIAPSDGGTVTATNLFTDLAFTWNGIAYDETTANTGWLTFSEVGDLIYATFGSSCAPLCSVVNGTNDWSLTGSNFTYAVPGFSTIFINGTGSFTRRLVQVPEPGVLGLLSAGLMIITFARPHNRKRSFSPVAR